MRRCSCASYNGGGAGTPERILEVPENIRRRTDGRLTVCVDECIADAVLMLWGAGLPTLNSCCGHNEQLPSIVVPEDSDLREYMNKLRGFDDREWSISRWEWVRMVYSFEEIEWG